MDRNPIFHGFSRIVAIFHGLVVIDEIEKEKEGDEKREEEEISQMAAETDEATVVCKNNNNNKMEASLVSYPCSAINRYECPYEKGKVKEGENANFDVDTLFT